MAEPLRLPGDSSGSAVSLSHDCIDILCTEDAIVASLQARGCVPYSKSMTGHLLQHVGLAKESHHEQLLLLHVQPRTAVYVPIQVHPASTDPHGRLEETMSTTGTPATVQVQGGRILNLQPTH